MFSDSQVAKTFACGKTKCKYLVCHGITPCGKEILTKSLMELEHHVCLFDESCNNIVKKGQMDIHIRYWDTSLNIVKARGITTHGSWGKQLQKMSVVWMKTSYFMC